MNSLESGRLIAKLRKEAGYTQKELAEALFVTDKAVSKWERGLCLPDSALLTRLSMLLDADIEYLISGKIPYGTHRWVGELRVKELRGVVAGKPIIHYLLSYFMLVGITDIAIITGDREYVDELDLEQYGLNIFYSSLCAEKTMIIYDKFLLFGVNITRQFQHCMTNSRNVTIMLEDKEIPIVFQSKDVSGVRNARREDVDIKSLGRGTVYIPLDTIEGIEDATNFVELYEKYHKTKIANLNEVAVLRGLI